MKHEEAYHQPTDVARYPHAPGPLCATYPSICVAAERVIVAYSYNFINFLPQHSGESFLEVWSLPTQWFYENP